MATTRGGVNSVTFAGIALPLGDSVTTTETRTNRIMRAGLAGPVGTTPIPVVPKAEVEIYDTTSLDLRSLEGKIGPLQVTYGNGAVTVISDAELVDPMPEKDQDGKATLTFMGLAQDWFDA